MEAARALDRGPYTYRIPDSMRVELGHRVWVPFGPRSVYGYVIGISEEEPAIELKEIERADRDPMLLPVQLELAGAIGTLSALGTSFTAIGAVKVDTGATWQLSGTAPATVNDGSWIAYLYIRDNPKGAHTERWRHLHPVMYGVMVNNLKAIAYCYGFIEKVVTQIIFFSKKEVEKKCGPLRVLI